MATGGPCLVAAWFLSLVSTWFPVLSFVSFLPQHCCSFLRNVASIAADHTWCPLGIQSLLPTPAVLVIIPLNALHKHVACSLIALAQPPGRQDSWGGGALRLFLPGAGTFLQAKCRRAEFQGADQTH